LTRWFDGHGWRCRWHVPEGFEPFKRTRLDGTPPPIQTNLGGDPGEPAPSPIEPCPVKKLRNLKDVEKMCNWAAIAVATGTMSDSRGKAIVMLCREWRNAYGDRVLKKQQDKIARQQQALKRKRSGGDDDGEHQD
jgi:hypothetical protein